MTDEMADNANETDSPNREGMLHPIAPVMIVYTYDGSDKHAWVMHAETRAAVWQPDDVSNMAWLRGGTEIGIIGETVTPDPHKSPIIASTLQSEMSYWFERWTWPDLRRVSRCRITMRTGWPTEILPTPDPNLVFFEWYDQGEAGYEGIALDDETGDVQDPTESYEIGFVDDNAPLTFSPDARYLVRCYGRHVQDHVPCVWEQDALVARLDIIDRQTRTIHVVPLNKQIAANWQLADMPEEQQWTSACAFSDATHVTVQFVDGTRATVSVKAPDLAALPLLPTYPDFHETMPDRKSAAVQGAIDAYYRQRREGGNRIKHPHESVVILESAEVGGYPSKRREWVARADGQVLWDPGDALMMVWLFDGAQLGVIRGAHFDIHATAPQGIAFERWNWPDLTLISRTPLPDWSGEPIVMLASPGGTRLSIMWDDEKDIKRLMLHRLAISPAATSDQVLALVPMSYEGEIVAHTSDNARVVAFNGEGVAWPSHAPMFAHPRRFLAGTLAIYDEPHQAIRDIPLLADFPANWAPDLADRRSPLLPWYIQTQVPLIDEVRLVDDATLSVRFATGEERAIDITPPAPPPAAR